MAKIVSEDHADRTNSQQEVLPRMALPFALTVAMYFAADMTLTAAETAEGADEATEWSVSLVT